MNQVAFARMAAKYSDEIEKGVESLINCLICTDTYKSPKVLPCQHTFCLGCLQRYHDNYNSQRIIKASNFPCPQCRKTIYLPSTGIDGLPNDFKVGQIKEFFEKINITTSKGKGIMCDICRYEQKEKNAKSFCLQCSKYLCDNCTLQHNDNSLFKSHSTMNIDSPDISVLECQEHKEEIKYYCTACSAPLCTVCALAKHSKHETVDIATALETHRQSIAEKTTTLKAYIADFEGKGEHLAVIRKDKEEKLAVTQQSIRKHIEECIKSLRDQETRLLSELDNSHQASLDRLKQEEQSIQATVNSIQSVCTACDELSTTDQSLQLLATAASVQARLDKLVAAPCQEPAETLCHAAIFRPAMEMDIGRLVIGASGDVTTGSSTIDTKLEHASAPAQKMTGIRLTISSPAATGPASPQSPGGLLSPPLAASGGSNTPGARAAPSLTRTHSMPASITSSVTRRQRPPPTSASGGEVFCREGIKLLWRTSDHMDARDVAFLPDGSVVVTQHKLGSDKLQVYSSTGELKRAVSGSCSSQLIKPWGVAINSQSATIAVTDHGDSSVKFLDNELAVTQTWRRLFEKPCGIAVMRTGEYVITDVGERYLHKVSVYLPNGIRIRDFGSKGRETGQLLSPQYVAVDHQDRIVLSDGALGCVKVMDRMGKQLLSFGPTNERGEPFRPHGVAVDAQNNIIVADHTYRGATLFSPDGRFIQHLVQTEVEPYGIAVHDSGTMAVTSNPSIEMVQVPIFKVP